MAAAAAVALAFRRPAAGIGAAAEGEGAIRKPKLRRTAGIGAAAEEAVGLAGSCGGCLTVVTVKTGEAAARSKGALGEKTYVACPNPNGSGSGGKGACMFKGLIT